MKNWYRETIEALGMRAPKNRITNKLNSVAAHADDVQLRRMTEILISEILSANLNTSVTAPKEAKFGVPSAKSVLAYCESLAYQDK